MTYAYIILFLFTILNIIVPVSGQLTVTPIFTLFTSVHSAIAIATVFFLATAIVRVFIFWKNIKFDIVKSMLPVSIIGAVAGSFALVQIPANILLAVILLFCIHYLFKKLESKFLHTENKVEKTNKLAVGFIGLFSGFLQGTGLAGSDLRNSFLYAKNLSIPEVHGTTAVMGGANFLFATLVRLHANQISVSEILNLLIVFLPLTFVATYIGKLALIKIPKNISDWIVISVMVIGSLILLYKIIVSF